MLHFDKHFSLPEDLLVPDCHNSGEGARLQNAEETGRVPTLPEEMKSEQSRLHTFRNWSAVECSRKLVRYGFYVSTEGDCVKCAFCGLEICAFSSAQEVQLWHFQVAKNDCPLLKGQESGDCNEETRTKVMYAHGMSREFTVDPEANRQTERLQLLKSTPGDVPHSRTRSSSALNDSSSCSCCPAANNSSSSASPSAVVNPSPSSTPQRSPPHLNLLSRDSAPQHLTPQSSSTSNPHIQKTSPSQRHHGTKKTTETRTSSSSTQSSPLPASTTTTTTTTWADIVRTARFPEMMSYQARFCSFSKWPLIKPTPKELARAGLFYDKNHQSSSFLLSSTAVAAASHTPISTHRHTHPPHHALKLSAKQGRDSSSDGHVLRGSSSAAFPEDSVQCFWCGERIHRWQKTDDALLEHARLSPECRYVIQLLGQQLHHDVITATS